MAFYISPSVNIFESDFQSLAVVQEANYIGGSAGFAPWGPANIPVSITGGEGEFVTKFHNPDDSTYLDMMTSIDFLTYSAKMWYIRVVGKNAKNATTNLAAVLVQNEDEIDEGVFPGQSVIARYPGSLGNGLILDVADAARFPTWEFAQAFEYTPGVGEFAVAVVDGSGRFSGQGKSKQRESLSVYGEVNSAPTSENRKLVVAGGPAVKPPNRTYWQVTLQDNSKPGSITVGRQTVSFLAGEFVADIHTRIGRAMVAQPDLFDTVTVSALDVVALDYTATGQTVVIDLDPDSPGTNTLRKMDLNGTAGTQGRVKIEDVMVTVKEGDTAILVAKAVAEALSDSLTVKNVVYVTGEDELTYDLVAKGPQPAPVAVDPRQDMTYTFTTVIPGAPGNEVVSVFGVDVLVNAQMTAAQATSAIATALAADAAFTAKFDDIRSERTTVHFTHKTAGLKPAQTAPENQGGLEFSYGISSPGQTGTMLERYEIQTTKPGDKFSDGTLKNIFDSLRQSSRYVFWGDRLVPFTATTYELDGGVDDYNVSKEAGIKMLDNSESLDVNYVWIAGSISEQKALADVVETRRDAVGHLSPQFRNVVNNKGRETEAVHDWRVNQVNRDSTYLFNNDNWGLIYDKYNDKDRWIPACGGTAGMQARAALQGYPWSNFSGHQRGLYKNYKRMAWSANKGSRDALYKVGVNSAVTFPAEGIVLYGDKMSTQRPSSFSRVNVRMAFIVAQKSLANFSRQYLFEVNDAYTRNQWLNAARPFLRNMVSGRAFEDFQVICDERNNGADVRVENRMVGHIRIKPLYSINWIDLHFDAVRPGIEFDEVELT